MFKTTAKRWREENPERAFERENPRDAASINELTVLSILESLNATLIGQGVSKKERFQILTRIAEEQKEVLDNYDYIKSIKKVSKETYTRIEHSQSMSGKFNQSLKTVLAYNPNEDDESK